MPNKIIISENQLRLITNHINSDNRSINEGFKELSLGLLLLIGIPLSGQNEFIAQKALSDPNIVKQLDNIFSNEQQLDSFIEKINNQMPSAGKKIEANIEKIKQSLFQKTNNK